MTAHEYVLPQTCRYSGKEQEDVSELTQDGGERQAGLSRVHAERPVGSCTLTVCQRQRPLANNFSSNIFTLCMTQPLKSISELLTGSRYAVSVTFLLLVSIIY